jgi:metal-sulfur cluster biosynthetic enzyme
MVFGFNKKKVEPAQPVVEQPVKEQPITIVKSMDELKAIEPNKEIIEQISKVKDPELDLDIWNLGLIYNIESKDKDVKITMTFTSPLCPFGPQIVQNIKDNLESIDFKNVEVDVVIEPRWEPSEEVRSMLGF